MPPRRRRRPRGHVEQLPSGSYRARVYAGTDPLTRRARYVKETAPTFAEAQKAMARLQRQVDEDQHPKTDITVRQAIEQWLDVVELAETTRERYDDLIRLYVLPSSRASCTPPATPTCSPRCAPTTAATPRCSTWTSP